MRFPVLQEWCQAAGATKHTGSYLIQAQLQSVKAAPYLTSPQHQSWRGAGALSGGKDFGEEAGVATQPNANLTLVFLARCCLVLPHFGVLETGRSQVERPFRKATSACRNTQRPNLGGWELPSCSACTSVSPPSLPPEPTQDLPSTSCTAERNSS